MVNEDQQTLEKLDNLEEKELLSEKHVRIIDPVGAQKLLGNCSEDDPSEARMILKVYPRRWIVLLVVALVNNLNTLAWISFAPVANYVDAYYDVSGATNYFTGIFMICTVPVGLFAMWAGGRFGIRWTILLATWVNAIGAVIRFTSSFAPIEYRFAVAMIGQLIAALAYPFIMFLPTKVAGAWFPENQRALATTIGIMANPMGVLVANLLCPYIVTKPDNVFYINILISLPAVFVAILATLGINRSEPKLPPTVSAGQKYLGFIKGMKTCFTSRQYLILLLVMGGGIGMFNALYATMQQMLCPSGYPNQISGFAAALMIIGGVVGATVAGIFVDKTRFYEETMKVSMGIAVVFGIIFLQLARYRDIASWILLVCFFFGVMGLATYPVGLQLSAECTYPVSEATSSGLIVLSGQIQSVIYLAILAAFAKPLEADDLKYQVCFAQNEKPNAKNMTVSFVIMSVIAAVIALILIVFFRPKYRRSLAEKGVLLNAKTNEIRLVEEIDIPADSELDLKEAKPLEDL